MSPATARRHHRARCTLHRSLRSAALALAVVGLPEVIAFTRHGHFDRAALAQLAHALGTAALMVLFNYVQRLREQESQPKAPPPRRPRHRDQDATPPR